MKANRALAACLIAAGILVGGSTSLAVDNPPFVRITPAEVRWQDLKTGTYVIRVRFPPHLMDSPH